MKYLKTLFLLVILSFAVSVFTGCSNMHMHTNAGVNMSFGPGGPRLDPYVNVGMSSSGGRYY